MIFSLSPGWCAETSPYEGISPIGSPLTAPTGVAADAREFLYVTESSANRLLVFSPDGALFREKTGLARPVGVAVSPDGKVLVGSAEHGCVEVFDRNLAPLYKLGKGDGEFSLPLGIAVNRRGTVYVADGKADRIRVYDGVGAFLFSFGGIGNADGRFRFPAAIACDGSSEEIVVSDLPATPGGTQGARIQVFSRDGTFKRRFASFGVGEGLLVKPLGLAVDGAGRILVTDAYQNVVQAFDGGGTFLFAVHDPSHPVRTPLGIAVGPVSGKLYVASLNTAQVAVFGAGGGDGGSGDATLTFEAGGGSCSVGGRASRGASAGAEAGLLLAPVLWAAVRRRARGRLLLLLLLAASAASSARAGPPGFAPAHPLAPNTDLIHYPHIDAHDLKTCEVCHFMDQGNPYLMPDWAIQVPVDNDDTMFNNLCRHCHNDIVAPFAKTHSSLTTDTQYGDWNMECVTCHEPHCQQQLYVPEGNPHLLEGTVQSVTDNALTATSGGWSDNQYQGLLLIPNRNQDTFVYRIDRNSTDTLYTTVPMDPTRVAPSDPFAVAYGKLVRERIATLSGGTRTVRLFRDTGANSLADGDGVYDGVCEVCHTKTACYRCSAQGSSTHRAGERCTQCHAHAAGFRTTAGGAHAPHLPVLSCEAGNQGCHGTYDPPLLGDGTDLANTGICDGCHSPGGTYDGVDDPVTGAKTNWANGVYLGGDLASGREKWCAGCHDEAPSDIAGVAAPNVIGDEDGLYGYGTGWGYFRTGHGLSAGTYPASQGPAANLACTACHDRYAAHIDGISRTYDAADDNYQAGYRLKRPMDIPRTDVGEPVSDFSLCLDCHPSARLLVPTDLTTNFRNGLTTNAHWLHLQSPSTGPFAIVNIWDSDWNGTTDSKINCPACHNVHGSPSPRMIRHGELISTPGTTDKVPSINFRYTPYSPTPYPILADSTGGQLNPLSPGGGSVGNTGICYMCHSNSVSYARTPGDDPPWIRGAYGSAGSNTLTVFFSEGVFTDSGGSGALYAGDFSFVDLDDGRTITGIDHAAGSDVATVWLSSLLDLNGDLGTDTLAAATAASIYDAAGNPMDTTPVTVEEDTTSPAVSDPNPANGATGILRDSNITFSLTDGQSGVDWGTLSIQLTGDLGYSRVYTSADAGIVSATGVPSAYSVTVDPDTDFSDGEVITVAVDADDRVGNPMTTAVWSFSTAPAGSQQTAILHPSGIALDTLGAEINWGYTIYAGSGWTDILDSNDGDTTYGGKCCDGTPSTDYNHLIALAMDDLSAIGGAAAPGTNPTIVSLRFFANARFTTKGGGARANVADNMKIGYRTDTPPPDTAPAWENYVSLTAGGYDFQLVSSVTYPGPFTLADIDDLKVYVRWERDNGYLLRITEVYAEVVYIPGN